MVFNAYIIAFLNANGRTHRLLAAGLFLISFTYVYNRSEIR